MDWDIFLFASENNIDVNMDTVTEFIRKRIGDVVPTVTIKTESVNHGIYPLQSDWEYG